MKLFLKTVLILTVLLGLIIFYAFLIEPSRLTVKTVEIKNNTFYKIFKNQTIIHLSDLHLPGQWTTVYQKTLDQIEKLQPDYIFLTGDYVRWFSHNKSYENALRFFEKLRAKQAIYAVFGDADRTNHRAYCRFCHQAGSAKPQTSHDVKMLRNELQIIKADSQYFQIAGIDDGYLPQSFLKALPAALDTLPTIVLAHSSIYYNKIAADNTVLYLSGDTHGGQIWLPDVAWRYLKRKKDYKHMSGHFTEQNKHLFVSQGIGMSDIYMRLGVPPQLAVIRFVEEENR